MQGSRDKCKGPVFLEIVLLVADDRDTRETCKRDPNADVSRIFLNANSRVRSITYNRD